MGYSSGHSIEARTLNELIHSIDHRENRKKSKRKTAKNEAAAEGV